MEQQNPSITHLEAAVLSEITPEEAHDLVLFMRIIPEPKKINSSMTWDDSYHIDNLLTKIRSFLSIRAGMIGGAI